MIPKKIHYCWLSGEDMPSNIQMCINSWKEIMPEYELILWDKDRFEIKSVLYVEEACKAKKWAFAADYIRSYALYKEGGIYMDSDVLVKKKFDQFLKYDFFTSVRYNSSVIRKRKTLDLLNEDGTAKIPFTRKPGFGIQAAVLGSIKGHPYLEDCLAYYSDKHFIIDDRSISNQILASDLYAMLAEKYGYKYKNELQHLNNNMLILPSEIFAGDLEEATDNSYAIHYCAGSWTEPTIRSTLRKILENMKMDKVIRELVKKPRNYKL
ncbi:MAG: glycosyltransferase [Bacteroidales bacterium]